MNLFKNKKNISLVLILLFVMSIFLANTSISLAQNTKYSTGKTLEIGLYKANTTYKVLSLAIKKLAYPYLSDSKLLVNKIHYGKVISFSGKPLGYFTVDGITITKCWDEFKEDGSITGGCEDVPEGNTLIRIPYFNNGAIAEIYDLNNQKILTIDLSKKAVCNENNMCNVPIENSLNCAVDCKNKEPVIVSSSLIQNDYSILFDNQVDNSQRDNTSRTPWWANKVFFWSILIILILILIFWFFRGLFL